jgi:transcriptional regulator with XRE-family HTH domain
VSLGLGNLLLAARVIAGYSQTEAARLALISQAYLSRIEHDKQHPRPPVRERLFLIYNLEPEKMEQAIKRCTVLVGALWPWVG